MTAPDSEKSPEKPQHTDPKQEIRNFKDGDDQALYTLLMKYHDVGFLKPFEKSVEQIAQFMSHLIELAKRNRGDAPIRPTSFHSWVDKLALIAVAEFTSKAQREKWLATLSMQLGFVLAADRDELSMRTQQLSEAEWRVLKLINSPMSYGEFSGLFGVDAEFLNSVDLKNDARAVFKKLRNRKAHVHLPEQVSDLRVYIDPGDAPAELITEFYTALAVVYRAYGGSGLEIVDDERRALAAEVAL